METPLNMDDRYGRKRSNWRFLPYAIFMALIGWLFWVGFYHSNPTVTANLLSFKELNEKTQMLFENNDQESPLLISMRQKQIENDKLKQKLISEIKKKTYRFIGFSFLFGFLFLLLYFFLLI